MLFAFAFLIPALLVEIVQSSGKFKLRFYSQTAARQLLFPQLKINRVFTSV